MRPPCLVFLAGLLACGHEGPPPPSESAPAAVVGASPGDATPPERPRGGPGCIRSGSTREEVRAVMGEPDSIAYGAWIYGRSSVTFGYGTVLDLENDGGDLIIC